MIHYEDRNLRVADFHTHFAGDSTKFEPTIARIFERMMPHQAFVQRNVGRDPNALIDYLDKMGVDIACVLAEEGPPTCYSVSSDFIVGYALQIPDRLVAIGN